MTTPWDVDATNVHFKPSSPNNHHFLERKKLQLKPRSIPLDAGAPSLASHPSHDKPKGAAGVGFKCDPFGDALPREEVLRRRSLDHPQATDLQSDALLNAPPTPRRPRVKSLSARGSPFGDAVPREQVLWQRGIDPSELDLRIEQKAHHTYTPRQDAELDAIQRELTRLEILQRELNEKELPEEEARSAVEAKREELHALMEHFNKVNEERSPGLTRRRRGSERS